MFFFHVEKSLIDQSPGKYSINQTEKSDATGVLNPSTQTQIDCCQVEKLNMSAKSDAAQDNPDMEDPAVAHALAYMEQFERETKMLKSDAL